MAGIRCSESEGGAHRLDTGLLLRSDLHTLFDRGYVTIDPNDQRLLVGRRIREEFENWREYYVLDGRPIALPIEPGAIPSRDNLLYHTALPLAPLAVVRTQIIL